MDIVLSMFGADQPGLVAELTRILYEEEANLGDADMTRIDGTFAFILSLSLPSNHQQSLETRLDDLTAGNELVISLTPAGEFESDWGNVEADTIISVYGADKPGIVYRVSDTLANLNINICDLHSSLDESEGLYIMSLEVRRPDNLELGDLRGELTDAGDELDVDVTVRDITDSRL